MNKEVKVGMTVLLVLLVGLGTAFVYRVCAKRQKSQPTETNAPETAGGTTPRVLRSGPAEPTVLETAPGAQQPPGAYTASSNRWERGGHEEAPRTSFIPKDPPADDRYAHPAGDDLPVPADRSQAPLEFEPPSRGEATLSVEVEAAEPAPAPDAEDADDDEPQPLADTSARFLPSTEIPAAPPEDEPLEDELPDNQRLPPSLSDSPAVPAQHQKTAAGPYHGADRYQEGAAGDSSAAAQLGPQPRTTFQHATPVAQQPPYRALPQSTEPGEPFVGQQAIGGAAAQAAVPRRENTGKYYVEPGDSFWTIAQKVYGDGAFFKALIEHNRARYPQPGRLRIGDEIATPSEGELRAKYSGLCPKERHARPGTPQVAAVSSRVQAGGRTYVVEEGDTLYDIARYELGDARRWPEIFQLNRPALGDDIDYLRPGTQLVLPAGPDPGDVLTNQPAETMRR